jgi:hypothetical protein
MKKALYIIEFSREDSETESEWFVGEHTLDYGEMEKQARAHLNNLELDWGQEVGDEPLTTIENIFIVADELIKEVAKSYEDKE